MTRPAPVLAALALLLACAGAPRRTVLVRGFLGADPQGGYAFAELTEHPGTPARARLATVRADGRLASEAPLAVEPAALARALAAGERAERTAEDSLGHLAPQGFEPGRAALLPAGPDGGRWELPPAAGVLGRLELRREGDELRLAVRAEGIEGEVVAHRFPAAGTAWVSGVLLLPGGRRALALVNSASARGDELARLEGLAELDLGAALARLLDAAAVGDLQRGELELARDRLDRAVELAPDDAVAHYNLACVLALSDREDPALRALARAIELDGERLRPLALRDPDLASLREAVEFQLMIEPRLP